jgi:hypothetical protein
MACNLEIVDVPLPVFTNLLDGRHGVTIATAGPGCRPRTGLPGTCNRIPTGCP